MDAKDIRKYFSQTATKTTARPLVSSPARKPAKPKPISKENKSPGSPTHTTNNTSPTKQQHDPSPTNIQLEEPAGKKKRLLKRKVIQDSSDSDDDVVVVDDDETYTSKNQDSKSVGTWIREELKLRDPQKLEDLEKDNVSAENIQTDIQYWCSNEKKLVDPAENLNKVKRTNVDVTSYMQSLQSNKGAQGDDCTPKSQNLTQKSLESVKSDGMSFKVYEYSTPKAGENDPERALQRMKEHTASVMSNQPKQEPVSIELSSGDESSPKKQTVTIKTVSYRQVKRKRTEGEDTHSPGKLVKDYKSPRKVLKTIELTKPEPMENLFGSQDSSPGASPTVASMFTTVSEDPSPTKKRTYKRKGPKPPEPVDDDEDTVRGKKFVFTGELSIDRDEATYRVRKLGGLVVSGVSGQTNYLVHGEKLEDGRPYNTGVKYKKANDLNKNKGLNIQIINEEQFMALLASSNTPRTAPKTEEPKAAPQSAHPTPRTATEEPEVITLFDDDEADKQEGILFEKYRPKTLRDLIGNSRLIERLSDWVRSYDSFAGSKHVKGTDQFKAALLSGPPGIGKTTCARLVAEQAGYYVMEFNASDQRSKSAVERITPLVTGTVTLTSFQSKLA